ARPQATHHLLEVPQLVAGEPSKRPEEVGAFGVPEQQAHGRRGSLLLTVRVVDEDLVELHQCPREPRLTGGGGQVQDTRTGLAQAVWRPKRGSDPASEPVGIDPEGLTQDLERERAVAIATLDPREITAERSGASIARREQAPQAVLQHREPELQLARERATT